MKRLQHGNGKNLWDCFESVEEEKLENELEVYFIVHRKVTWIERRNTRKGTEDGGKGNKTGKHGTERA